MGKIMVFFTKLHLHLNLFLATMTIPSYSEADLVWLRRFYRYLDCFKRFYACAKQKTQSQTKGADSHKKDFLYPHVTWYNRKTGNRQNRTLPWPQ
jgi:hypothetical protein